MRCIARAPLLLAALLLMAASAEAARWQPDPARSRLAFTATQQGQSVNGSFGQFTAEIEFDPAALDKSSVNVTIPVTSIATGTPMYDDELPKPEWFDFAKFPTAHFVAGKFTDGGNGKYVAEGMLTIRDVTLPLTLPFTLEIAGNTAHMLGEAQIDRTTFGVGSGDWAGEDEIGHSVTVRIDLTATRLSGTD